MKFSMKIAMINILLVTATFSLCGWLLISHSHSLVLKREINNQLARNQVLCTATAAEIINSTIQNNTSQKDQFLTIGESIYKKSESGLLLLNAKLEFLYASDDSLKKGFEPWMNEKELFNGNYVRYFITEDKKLYTVSSIVTDLSSIYLVTSTDISYIYQDRNSLIMYYRIILTVVSFICAVLIYFLANYLTAPIRKLRDAAVQFGNGDYVVRTDVTSSNELGDLAGVFNKMAGQIQLHVEELKIEAGKRDDFVANFTHEVKTPLTAVIGYADMIRSKDLAEQERIMAADYIFREGKRLENMSMKLFDLIIASDRVIENKKISLNTLIRDVIDSATPILEQWRVRVESDNGEEEIYGDRDLLHTAILNLIDNAIKASGEGDIIEVHYKRDLDSVILQIIDYGRGIPEDEISRVTEPFYMVDKSRTRQNGGAGLGLAMVKRILEHHHAEMEIFSRKGKGTTIQIRFIIPSVNGGGSQ